MIVRALFAAAAICSAVPASAQSPLGVWLRGDGAARVAITACGASICGDVVWLRDANSPARVGQRVFSAMRPSGENQWEGEAFNPEDGQTYNGRMTIAGDRLEARGCVVFGLLCKTMIFSRFK